MRKNRIRNLSLLLVLFLFASFWSIPVSANNTDSDFAVGVYAKGVGDAQSERKKDDSTSTYLNYSTRVNGSAASGVYQWQALIYGANSPTSTQFTDCTSVIWGTSISRPKAIITKGTKGYIRQDVRERFGSYAHAKIVSRSTGYTGNAIGKWSPDSVWESGCKEYNL